MDSDQESWQCRLKAMRLFEPVPKNPAELRKTYLRLALRYHPDKCPEEDRHQATQLFQAIAAVYEDLLKGEQCGCLKTEQARLRRVKTQVAAAAELGDLKELRRLLEEMPSRAVEEDFLGVCPLMFAAASGCVEAAEILLEYGATVSVKTLLKWSVLLYATLGGHVKMVQWLVAHGADITEHEVALAAFTGNAATLEALLELNPGTVESLRPDIRTDLGQKSLLHLACEGLLFLKSSAENHAKCIDHLLRWQAPVDELEHRLGRTCLQTLVADSRWKTKNFENSPMHMYAVTRLCEAGANVRFEDNQGDSAVSLATSAGLLCLRELLLAYS